MLNDVYSDLVAEINTNPPSGSGQSSNVTVDPGMSHYFRHLVRRLDRDGDGIWDNLETTTNPFDADSDGDDGAVDGIWFAGDTWIGITKSGFTISSRIRFDFLPDDQGRYPNYVGIVITGADDVDITVDRASSRYDGRSFGIRRRI